MDLTQGIETINSDDVQAQEHIESVAAETMDAGAPESSESSESIDSAAIERALVGADVEPEQAPEGDPEDVESEPDKPLSPYQKRVQGLVARAKDAEEKLQQFQAQTMRQMYELRQQMESQKAEQEQQKFEALQKEIADLRRSAADEKLTPEEKARRDFIHKLKAEALEELKPVLSAKDQELTELKSWKEQLAAQAEKQRQYQQWRERGVYALQNAVLKDFDPEDFKSLAPETEEMLYAYAGAYGINDPAQAAPYLNAFLAKYLAAANKKLAKGAGKKVAAGQAVPKAIPNARPGAGQGMSSQLSKVTLAQLNRNGYDHHLDWIRKGQKPLSVP